MMEKKIILLGASDFSREIMYAALEHNDLVEETKLKPIAFVEKDIEKIGKMFEGIKVVSLEQAKELVDENVYFIAAIGFPELRETIIEELLKIIPSVKFATIIHRSAVIMPNCKIEDGVYIGPNATVAIGCSVKSHVTLNFNVSIGHDCIIDEYSVVSPGCLLSGRTEIGKKTFLGSGVITYQGIKIGNNCAVSAGVVVSRNINDSNKIVPKPNTMTLPMKSE